jgi:hypothetical protein
LHSGFIISKEQIFNYIYREKECVQARARGSRERESMERERERVERQRGDRCETLRKRDRGKEAKRQRGWTEKEI